MILKICFNRMLFVYRFLQKLYQHYSIIEMANTTLQANWQPSSLHYRKSEDMTDSPPGNGPANYNGPVAVPIAAPSSPPADSMKYEKNRLDTFNHPSWKCFMDRKKLARCGFYYFGKEDHVRCAFCRVEIGRWLPGDDCETDHQRWGPMCPFLRGIEVDNIPIDPTTAVPTRPRSEDICGRIGMEIRPNTVSEEYGPSVQAVNGENISFKSFGVNPHNGPIHNMYATEQSRLATFKEWPRSLKQKPKELAEAGFYYTGRGDQTTCFHCGLGLKDWEENDDPWEQHARWYSKCTHVALNKSSEFIQQVINKQPPLLARDAALELIRNSGESSRKKPKSGSSSEVSGASSDINSEMKSSAETSTSSISTVSEPVAVKTGTSSSSSPSPPGDEGCLCQICYLERWNVLFLPCKHALACKKCAPLLTTCPLCREPITATLRIYPSCNHDHRDTS